MKKSRSTNQDEINWQNLFNQATKSKPKTLQGLSRSARKAYNDGLADSDDAVPTLKNYYMAAVQGLLSDDQAREAWLELSEISERVLRSGRIWSDSPAAQMLISGLLLLGNEIDAIDRAEEAIGIAKDWELAVKVVESGQFIPSHQTALMIAEKIDNYAEDSDMLRLSGYLAIRKR